MVCCVLKDGTVGFGEGVPREYVTGETVDTALELLQKSNVQSQLNRCQNFAEVLEMAESLKLNPIPGDDRQCQGNAARCALELAILDAGGRCYGETLTNATKMLAPELYSFLPKVQYSGAITSAKGFKAKVRAWAMRIYGFSQLKIKVGMEGYDDAKRLQSIRKRVGKKMDLRVDANEAWSSSEAVEKIRELEPCNLSSVEQPIPHEQVNHLSEIRKEINVPIMLDESLCSMVDAERALERGTCDVFNVRISKCGGYLPSLRLAQFAKKHNLAYQLGCQVGETAILSGAGRHFATSVSGLRAAEGSYDRHLVKEALGTEDITFRWGGWAPAMISSGHSVEVASEALERVTVRRIDLI